MLQISSNLRPRDFEELTATRYGTDPKGLAEGIARDAVHTGAFRWAAYLDGRPVAAVGAFPRWPNVWTAWAFGTDEWPKVVLRLTKHVRGFMLPALLNAGATRVDALSLETHSDARAWLEYLGARPENVLDKWGKNGQNFVCYVWTRETAKQALARPLRAPRGPSKGFARLLTPLDL